MVVVRPGDPKAWWSKALDVLRVVDKDLGFAEGVHCDPNHSMASSFFFSYIIPWLSLFFFSGTFIFCLEILFFYQFCCYRCICTSRTKLLWDASLLFPLKVPIEWWKQALRQKALTVALLRNTLSSVGSVASGFTDLIDVPM